MKRDMAQRRREVEGWLDHLAEAAEHTEGDISLRDVPLTVADDLIDYLATFCRLPEPEHKTDRGVAWRETSGPFRGLHVRLATAAKRYINAA